MATFLLLLLPTLAAAIVPNPRDPAHLFARDCTGNNCVRAIRASYDPTRNGAADCSTYLEVTVTPATSTSTSTVTLSFTVTVTDDVTATASISATAVTTAVSPAPKRRRQETVSGSTYPAYASACSSYAAYSSACSCVGVTAPTTTLPTPVAVTTVTVSATATVTNVASFLIQVSGGSLGVTTGQYLTGQDLQLEYVGFTTDTSSALVFAYMGESQELVVTSQGSAPFQSWPSGDSWVIIGNDVYFFLDPLVCSVNQDNNTISCNSAGSANINTFQNCGGSLLIYDPNGPPVDDCGLWHDLDIILNIVATT